ncbi:hypothetical protein [Nostoc sp.]|nr:hypothetical protein [Nostoc sp. S13]
MESRQPKNPSNKTSAVSNTSRPGIFEPRSFGVQGQTGEKSQQPDLKTSLMRTEKYGHHLDRMQPHENVGESVVQCTRGKIPKEKKKKVRVDPKTKDKLERADQAIDYTRENLPYGAGNQRFDIKNSRGESAARTAEATELDTPSYPEGPWVQERAANAMRCGAGNCDDMGAVAHSFLGSPELNPSMNQPINYVSQDSFSHTYSMIGDTKDKNSVVVDAWPRRRQAHLKKHMNPEWQTDLDASIKRNANKTLKQGGLLYTTPADGEEGFTERATKAIEEPAISLTDPKAGVKKALELKRLNETRRDEYIEDVISQPGIYSQSSSTKDGNRYKYVLDDTLNSPADTESDSSADSDSTWSTDTDEEEVAA